MEFFDRLGDIFNAVTAFIERLIRSLFGSSNERDVRRIGFRREKDGRTSVHPGSTLDRINQLEPEYERLSDGELKETASRMRARMAGGQTVHDILPEAFAAARESGKRYLKMRHYDVQMVGGYVLNQGKIAEMVTGEGKTLVATLPAALNAMAGKVHVVTVNDYLAKRDMEWMGPLYLGLGLSVGAIQSSMRPNDRQPSYSCDITYGTNNEFGFDYLRDNMKVRVEDQVQGRLDYAIVDEIDNILIDEARTPLIISGPAFDDTTKYPKADKIARKLVKGEDFEVKEKEHSCHMTDVGIRKAEELAEVESFYTAGNMEWPHLIDNALKAHHLYKRDVNYVVEQGEVVIVDEHTGRKMVGRQWSDGLHQAVEAKEGVRIKEVSQTLATITLQNYFKLYKKLCGMTGTAMTEAQEFYKIYGLDVVAVPTNRPMSRINYPDVIFRTEPEKWHAVVDEIMEVHKSGRPILVGTVSIEKSERLSNMLQRRGIQHAVLNAKYHEREAEFVAQAGRLGGVTIATNMAGRGTDIILGGNPEYLAWEVLKNEYASRLDVPKTVWDDKSAEIAEREGMKAEAAKVAEVGGLHVIGTERHDARRIDLQLRGRSGRQGDPGSSRFFLSLEDDLMRIFMGEKVQAMLTWLGMQEGEAIESPMVTRQIEKAQKRVEERHFESRKNLLEYDEVMDFQRKEVYRYRQRILEGANCRELILQAIDRQLDRLTKRPDDAIVMGLIEESQIDRFRHFLHELYAWDIASGWARIALKIEVEPQRIQGMEFEQLKEFLSEEAVRQSEQLIREQLEENVSADMDRRDWNWQALASWANRTLGMNTNDRELRKICAPPSDEDDIDRDSLERFLYEGAQQSVQRTDFSALETICRADFPQQQLAGWLNHQFTLQIDPAEIAGHEEATAAVEMLKQRLRTLYQDQEIRFPVSVGLTRFMPEHQGSDRGGLIGWANQRFRARLSPDALQDAPRRKIEEELLAASRNYYPGEAALVRIDEEVDRAQGRVNGHPDPQAWGSLVQYGNESLELGLQPQSLSELPKTAVKQAVYRAFERRYRPEMGQAERAILLEVLDTAWKEHLYLMDHLRQSIGLEGYAGKDPKVEFKRQGMRAFEGMWDRVREQVTGAIFRLEHESPMFLGHLWQITDTSHADAQSLAEEFAPQPPQQASPQQQQRRPEPEHTTSGPGDDAKPIEPIRNYQAKVGRNDPCPCGSGKKYKKCCGGNE
ncbi:MAG: preprotein translocase subunit SecA [Planctomyces sp.]|nr:preprotein translocase subunit SecA [Planctomyces sp.]